MSTLTTMAKHYEDYDLNNIFEEIGQRSQVAQSDPQAGVAPSAEWSANYAHLSMGDDALALGKRIARRLLRELHKVLCGSDPDNDADRKKLRESLGLGRDATIGAIAAVLAGPLGIAGAIAAAVAAIFVKHLLEPTWEETCQFWDEKMKEV